MVISDGETTVSTPLHSVADGADHCGVTEAPVSSVTAKLE